MNIEKVLDVFGLDVKTIDNVPESYSSTVYVLTLEDDEKVVLKIPYNKSKLFREKGVLDKLKGHFPVPEVLGFWQGDEEVIGALLLSYLPGQPITGQVTEALAYDLGLLLGSLHKVPMDNYCLSSTPSNDWHLALTNRFSEWVEECRHHYDSDFISQCEHAFKRLLNKLTDYGGPSLLHFDFRPGNVLILDDKITGLIDFESARGGAPGLDFTKIKTDLWDKYPETKAPFIEGYETMSPLPDLDNALPLYEFFFGFGGLAWCIRRKKLDDPFYDENLKQVTQYLHV
ncbi:aminoglycoside phosphotransferase family protein [Acidaminobacter sp. JC074]|uniref:phosphotransferase family protein n=1 Tax=Acidaminobacter sp. JC074 TaxID=2530199 RepID=UPI001F0DA356|nr:aminoglycoside phosphotransferase family protein [Acidaminobacter sp. JC074]MCH4888108.1 aminoglycoside phosphotransferase family protein [Acidaminobacter sp. JC074]